MDIQKYANEVIDDSDRKAWRAERRKMVCASEVAAILGESSFGSALEVQVRKWEGEPEDYKPSPIMEAGTRMEPVILEWFGDELGVTVERCGTLYQSKQWPWLGCTPDGLAHFQNPAVDVFVQAKNALFGSDWSIDADGILSPKRVWIQVQTEMAVTGKEAIYVAAICGGWDFKWALVHRDDEFIDGVIVPKTREFMDAVEAKEPLPVDFTDSGARALAKLYPEETPEKTMALPIEFMDLDDEYKVLVLAERTCKEQRTEIRNRVMEAMGEAAYGTLPDGTVWSWRTQHTEIKAKPAGSRTNRVLRRKGGK